MSQNFLPLYDLNPQQRYTRDLLANYSEKKVFYRLDSDERAYLDKLKQVEEMRKNPTWLGLIFQNVGVFVSKQFDVPFVQGILGKIGVGGASEIERDLLGDSARQEVDLFKGEVIGMDQIVEPMHQTSVDVSKF